MREERSFHSVAWHVRSHVSWYAKKQAIDQIMPLYSWLVISLLYHKNLSPSVQVAGIVVVLIVRATAIRWPTEVVVEQQFDGGTRYSLTTNVVGYFISLSMWNETYMICFFFHLYLKWRFFILCKIYNQ